MSSPVHGQLSDLMGWQMFAALGTSLPSIFGPASSANPWCLLFINDVQKMHNF